MSPFSYFIDTDSRSLALDQYQQNDLPCFITNGSECRFTCMKAAGDMRNALLTFLIHESPSLHIADIGCIPLCTSLISYLRIPQKQRCDRFFSFWYVQCRPQASRMVHHHGEESAVQYP